MPKMTPDVPPRHIMDAHSNLFLESSAEDTLLEDYFNDEERTIPTPLEISIFQRQMRSDPEFMARHERKNKRCTYHPPVHHCEE